MEDGFDKCCPITSAPSSNISGTDAPFDRVNAVNTGDGDGDGSSDGDGEVVMANGDSDGDGDVKQYQF